MEQAEIFLCFGVTDSHINTQLNLIWNGSSQGHKITIWSARELHATLASVPVIESLPGVCTIHMRYVNVTNNITSTIVFVSKFHTLAKQHEDIQYISRSRFQ